MPQGLASIERQDLRPLAVLVAFGVLLRVTVLLASTGILWPDTGLFVGSARSLLTDQPFSLHVYKTPLYPLFLSVFMWFGETHITGQAITVTQQLMGLASTLVFYLVARQVFGRTVALWSSLLFSAHTLQLFYELSVLSEAIISRVCCWRCSSPSNTAAISGSASARGRSKEFTFPPVGDSSAEPTGIGMPPALGAHRCAQCRVEKSHQPES